MKIARFTPVIPAVLLVSGITGIAVVKTFLGSVGLWSDSGNNRGSLSQFRSIAHPVWQASILSLELSVISTLLATALGVLISYLIFLAHRFSRVLALVTILLVVTPHIVAAVSFDLLLQDAGFLSRFFHFISPTWPQFVAGPLWLAVIFDFAWKESAFIALVLIASLPPHAEEMTKVAKTLGASPTQVLSKVLFPTIRPALLVSSGLAFIYSIGSYEATWLLGRTFPEPLAVMTFRLFSNSDLGVRPQAYASATVSITLVAATAVTLIRSLPDRLKS